MAVLDSATRNHEHGDRPREAEPGREGGAQPHGEQHLRAATDHHLATHFPQLG